MQHFRRADLAEPPRWITTPEGEAAIVKGRLIVCVLVASSQGVMIYSGGELIDVRGTQEDAVKLAEELCARWYPGEKKPAKKETGGGNPYAAPR